MVFGKSLTAAKSSGAHNTASSIQAANSAVKSTTMPVVKAVDAPTQTAATTTNGNNIRNKPRITIVVNGQAENPFLHGRDESSHGRESQAASRELAVETREAANESRDKPREADASSTLPPTSSFLRARQCSDTGNTDSIEVPFLSSSSAAKLSVSVLPDEHVEDQSIEESAQKFTALVATTNAPKAVESKLTTTEKVTEAESQPQSSVTSSWIDISAWLQGNKKEEVGGNNAKADPSSITSANNSTTSTSAAVIDTSDTASTVTNTTAATSIKLPSWLAWLDPLPEDQPIVPVTPIATSAQLTSTLEKSADKVATHQECADDNSQVFKPIQRIVDDDESIRTGVSAATKDTKDDTLFSDLKSLPSPRDNELELNTALASLDASLMQNDDRSSRSAAARSNALMVERKALEIRIPSRQIAGHLLNVKGSDVRIAESEISADGRKKNLLNELRNTISEFSRYDVKVASVSISLADLLDEAGDYEQSIKLFRDAISIYSSKLGDDHDTTVCTREKFGRVLENAKMYDEAINTFYLVTVMRRALKGEKDPGAADSLVSIARVLRKKSDYTQSIKELKRALKIYRESLGDADPKVSQTVDEIASLYVTIGDFEKSAAILEEVVKLKAATLGMKSKEVAQTLISLATTYECSEQFSKAMKALKKAYKISTEIGGYSSPESTATLNKIAHLYEATGDTNRASIAYLGVLRGRKIILGDDNLLVGETYYRLGRSLRDNGQTEKALKCMKEALPIYISKGVEVSDVETVAEIMNEMATIHKERGQLSESSRILQQELGVRRKLNQPELPLIARTLNFIGVVEYELKNYSKALKFLVEALTIFQNHGEQGVDCAEVLFNAGLVFEATRNNQERALEAFDEAARIFKEHNYTENHPHLIKCYFKIEKVQAAINQASGKTFY